MATPGVASLAAGAPLSPVAGGTVDLALFFIVGLLAGAHCLGMCGPLVTTYADRIAATGRTERRSHLTIRDVRQHGLFNLGRTAGYAAIGAVFGLLGNVFVGVTTVTSLASAIRGTIGILVGIAILAAGAGYLVGGTATARLRALPGLGGLFERLSTILTARIDRLAGSPGILGLGAVHAVVPCPILYPAYLYAFAVADPLRGGLALGILGLGTIPTLLAYGLALGSLSVPSRRRLHRAMGIAFLALGYLPLAHGLMLFGVQLPHPDVPFYQPL